MDSGKIKLREKISYGGGQFGLAILTVFSSMYLMYFYTDVVGISVTSVGLIMMIGGIVDAVSNLIMGIIIDKTNTRWGKARPYLLFMTIPFAISGILLFYSPNLGKTGKFIYALATYSIFTIGYTSVGIPLGSMLASLSDKNEDRLSFNMFSTIGSNIAQFIIASLGLVLIGLLGKNSEVSGFFYVSILFAIVSMISCFICFKNTEERIILKQDKFTINDMKKAVTTNLPWLMVFGITLLSFTGNVIRTQATLYFAQYYLQNKNISSVLLTIPTILAIPIAIVTPFLAKKFGKRNLVLVGCIVAILGSVGIYISKTNITAILVMSVISAIGFALVSGITVVLSADVIDYGEWKTGVRAQGILYSLIGTGIKVSLSLSSLITTGILSRGGYVANVEQTKSAMSAISFNYIWLPTILLGATILIASFYKLDKIYNQIIEELHERRKKNSLKETNI